MGFFFCSLTKMCQDTGLSVRYYVSLDGIKVSGPCIVSTQGVFNPTYSRRLPQSFWDTPSIDLDLPCSSQRVQQDGL